MAVNTDKQKYLVGETAKIQMAVVNTEGKPNCEANLKLTINGTETNKIVKSPTCGSVVFDNADYFSTFNPDRTGKYILKLTNLDTRNTITSSFNVVSERNLDITRKTATSITPVKDGRYPVRLIVTAKSDYIGGVSDTLPEGLTVVWWGPAKVEGNKISWQVDLKAGETKELVYEYTAPTKVPAVYTFKENGEWTIVATKSSEEPIKIPNIINKYK